MKRPFAALTAALLTAALVSGTAFAAAGGNSAAAKLCQKAGYLNVIGSACQSFTSPGDCVGYASAGGTLSPNFHVTFTSRPPAVTTTWGFGLPISGSGTLAPNQPIHVGYAWGDVSLYLDDYTGAGYVILYSDANGNFTYAFVSDCRDTSGAPVTTDQTVTVSASDGFRKVAGTGTLLCSQYQP